MSKHEEYLKEIQTELNKNWGSQPKSWWNVKINTIRNEHEATEKAHEELVRDVIRFMELMYTQDYDKDYKEYSDLFDKLSEVGNENER